ncbi:chromosome segregation ATPase family protein [Aspergillus heteromorphus CBS 117.55]|uniref:Chromosome segregation ATPase family protein n=1 Tax=Aspergillus heteromorphus CBS 117.55 TaxID=1448321 RepID=A0A317VPJ7_9EURO|nr:chromosome segregation ATPase family protein [Aspergillus heteromorphus CBS 117.55]PWY76304.1 chromosome segregation ATPase family protein [Aspergillus heteromorphus CBS 117.55]
MMPSHTREGSHDRELVVRNQSVPMWDSSDPERAPPPLPMNPSSTSPLTRGNVSPGIQAVAASFQEKMRESTTSPYTTNPMPPKSPEKSLIKGQFHRRMQSFQNTDARSEFLNYLENRSPERPQRASIQDQSPQQYDTTPTKDSHSLDPRDVDHRDVDHREPEHREPEHREIDHRELVHRDTDHREPDRGLPNLLISNRYLSRPILGESTPPSATMLALQNMQLPMPHEPQQPKSLDADPFIGPPRPDNHNFHSLSTQIVSLTDIASNLQREMVQLSRRSKDNATDLVSLKAATNARDEDIRKSLRDLSSNLAAKFLDPDAATRWDFSTLLGSEFGNNRRDSDSSPNSKRTAPRMSSPSPFTASIDCELCGSPSPISDGSASIALLEKVLREMGTKESQDKLLELVEEIKSRPVSDVSDKSTENAITAMLEEILDHVKEDAGNKALIRSHTVIGASDVSSPGNPDIGVSRTRSFGTEQGYEPDMEVVEGNHGHVAERSLVPADSHMADEMLSIMKRVKTSVIEGGGMTNEVKALVRELRGEVLGMGRNLARQIEDVQSSRAIEDKPDGPSNEDIAAMVEDSLNELRDQLASIIDESRYQSSSISEFRSAMDSAQIFGIVKKAVDELDLSHLRAEPQGPVMEKEDILETVREAWETYKPEIELQNFGLEREEILECLTEGLKEYKPQYEEAVTYDQVLAAVQAGVQNFEQPPSITKEEIVQTIHECLANFEPPAPRGVEPEHLESMRDEILQAVTESVTSQTALTRSTLDSGLGRDDILSAMSHGLESHFAAAKEAEHPHITKEDVANAINEAFVAQQSVVSTHVQPSVSRDDIINAIAEGLESQNSMTREIELNRDDLMEAISAGLHEANEANHGIGEQMLERVQEQFDGMKEELGQQFSVHEGNAEQLLNTLKDGFAVVRQEVEGYAANAAEASGKHEIMDTVKEGFRLLQADMEKTITETAFSSGPRGNPDTPELLDAMEKEFEHLRQTMSSLLIHSNVSNEKDEILDAIRDIADQQKNAKSEEILAAVQKLSEQETTSNNEEILTAIREMSEQQNSTNSDEILAAIREISEQQNSTNSDEILAAIREMSEQQNSTNSDEILAAIREISEQPKSTGHEEILAAIQEMLEQHTPSNNDEILGAIRGISEIQKPANNDDITDIIKQEFEELRHSMNSTLVRAEPTEPTSDKDEIIAALRESLEAFREETNQPKEGGENTGTANGEVIDAFTDGVGIIREDLAKLLERPSAGPDYSELLETLKEGLSNLKLDVEGLRQSQKESEEIETTRGGELMLASDNSASNDIEGLKALISQLQVKVEAIEAAPRAAEAPEDMLKKEHLDEVLLGLQELHSSVTGIVARDQPADEMAARKEDTDAIETLLRNTKAQLDEMTFPAPDEIARAEQLQSLEAMVKETKEAVSELSTRVESEGPTKSEIGTLETLMKDMWIALDEMKGKGTPEGEEENDAEKLVKADLQTVEAMIFEVKTQVEELKLPDIETLPTKTDIQDLTALVTEFREKVDADSEMTGQAFDARKVEHAGLAEKIEEARNVVEGLGDELRSKLDGSSEGLSELKQLLEGLAASAESFTTVENVNELTDLINREFERARGEQDATKLEKEERDAAAMVKHDETRAAIIVEIGTKIDEKLAEIVAKYDEVQSSLETNLDSKFTETAERDNAHLEAVTNTKALAEDIKLVIGSMGNSVNEACERMSSDAQTFFEKVDVSYTKMEEMHNDVKTQQEQARSDIERAAAATDRVESQLHEFHPQVLESIQEILAIVGQHYDHSQKSAQDIRMDLSTIPSSITPLLPALPPPEPEKYDDGPVHEKLNDLLERAKSEQVQETLNTLVERVTNDQVHEKLDNLLSHTTSTNGQVYEKLDELLEHAANTNGPVHEKLDTLIDHANNHDESVNQMMKLDEMHKDIMETSRRMNEMFAAQTAMVAEDNERRRKEAEEAAVALERRNAQREQVEAEIMTLREEKDSLLSIIHSLKTEKEDLVKQNTKLNKEVSGLEMALELRHEEMQVMEDRADSLEKRILEGVLDHARSVLLSRPNGPGVRKARGSRARGPSATSTASTAKDARSILGSSVGMALKKRGSEKGSGTPSGKERRILSLSNVTGNRGPGERQVSGQSGFASLKRSHSYRSNASQRKTSWGGRSSVVNKENDVFPEEDENPSGEESDGGTERRTSYTGTYADSMVYGTNSVASVDRRASAASSSGLHSIADDQEEDASDAEDDAHTTKADELDEASSKMVVYGHHSDSGLGADELTA